MNTPQPTRLIRVLIVDDHAMVRRGLAAFLTAKPDLLLVGEASDGGTAISLCERLQPDVVLMDTEMPIMDGIEATRIIRSRFSDTNVIILALQSDQTVSDTALQAGACQFLNKYCGQEKLFHAIKECSSGPARFVGSPPH